MVTPTMLSLNTFGDLSYKDQLTRGDMLKSDFVSNITTRVRPDVVGFNVLEIRKLRNELTEDEEVQFKYDYGKILTVIDLKVDWSCIRAIIRFWDSYYRCFSFARGIDLTPTLEEFAGLLCFPSPVSSIYQNVRFDSVDVKIRLDKLLGITTRLKEGKHVWCWSDIVKQFYSSQGKKRLKFLAFIIVGFVLLPKVKDYIDHHAANVFYEMEMNGINPTTTILAETFRSLDLCRRTGKGRLACCTQLLTVWLISHFKQRPDQSLFSPSYIGMNPWEKVIKGMGKEIGVDKWKMEEKEAWLDRFLNLSGEDIDLHAKWLRSVNPIVSCGYLRWVPLIGARGCVPYCPALVLRQFSILQIIPASFGMPSSSLPYSEDADTFRQYANEWRTPFCLEGHLISAPPTREYLEWRENRVNGFILPHSGNKSPIEEEGERHVIEKVSYVAHAQLMEQLRIVKEERDLMMKERDKLLIDKMDLELKMRGLEKRDSENVQRNLRNQRIANENFRRRLKGEVNKREISSALVQEKDAMIGILTSRIKETTSIDGENQVLRARVAVLEAEVEVQKKKVAVMEQMGENSTNSQASRC